MVDIKNPHVLDQMTTMQPLLLLLTLIVEVSCLKPTKLVTCEVSASALGQPANVTCSFHKVLDDPNTEIMVVHHPLGAAKGDLGNDVLVCFRSENADNPHCIARDGYLFNGNISNRLTLEISKATPESAGEYSCQIIPPDGIVVQSCNLSVQDNAVTPMNTNNYVNGPTDAGGSPCPQTERPGHQLSTAVPTVNSTTGNVHRFSQTDDCDIQTALAIFFGLVLVISIACNVVLFLRRHNRLFCRLFSERHRVNNDESAKQSLLVKQIESAPPISHRRLTARVHPETRDASSQLYNLVDLADESVVALYSRDQQPWVTPHISTDGNIFDNFTFCAPGKSSNKKKKNNNTHSATEQRDTGNILEKENRVKVKQL